MLHCNPAVQLMPLKRWAMGSVQQFRLFRFHRNRHIWQIVDQPQNSFLCINTNHFDWENQFHRRRAIYRNIQTYAVSAKQNSHVQPVIYRWQPIKSTKRNACLHICNFSHHTTTNIIISFEYIFKTKKKCSRTFRVCFRHLPHRWPWFVFDIFIVFILSMATFIRNTKFMICINSDELRISMFTYLRHTQAAAVGGSGVNGERSQPDIRIWAGTGRRGRAISGKTSKTHTKLIRVWPSHMHCETLFRVLFLVLLVCAIARRTLHTHTQIRYLHDVCCKWVFSANRSDRKIKNWNGLCDRCSKKKKLVVAVRSDKTDAQSVLSSSIHKQHTQEKKNKKTALYLHVRLWFLRYPIHFDF